MIMFGLIDCNNFYASCERVFNPVLKKLPVVVLSNNDGCVIARSNEAKQLGIPMGAPAFKFRDVFEQNNIQVFSSNYALYGDMSNRVMTILATFTPEIEIYSIDEAFLKFKGFETNFNLTEYGNLIRYTVTRGTGIPISVGIAPTKALAKVANKVAKKFPERTQHVYIIDTDDKRIKALKWLKIEDVWGIGYRYAKRLMAMNINNAYQFSKLSQEWVKKHMSVVGLRLHKELNGESCLDLEDIAPKKNIATTRSFDVDYTDYEKIKERVITFAVTCAEKLRKQKSCCNRILVFIHTNGFRENEPQYSKNVVLQLPYATNSGIELAKFAVMGLEKIFIKGFRYKKAGVLVMDFTPESSSQVNLFENTNPRHKPLMAAVDKINRQLGVKKLKLASQDQGRTWKMRQEKLSPRYTTNINEIITINCDYVFSLQTEQRRPNASEPF
jgi:DNA polymerase V